MGTRGSAGALRICEGLQVHLVSGERSDSSSNDYANCFSVKAWFGKECRECVQILRRAQKNKKSRIALYREIIGRYTMRRGNTFKS